MLQRRNVSIRRELRGEQLSDRYFSLDLATLGREAIRGLLNPGNKPASELNPLAVFAGVCPRARLPACPSLTRLLMHTFSDVHVKSHIAADPIAQLAGKMRNFAACSSIMVSDA